MLMNWDLVWRFADAVTSLLILLQGSSVLWMIIAGTPGIQRLKRNARILFLAGFSGAALVPPVRCRPGFRYRADGCDRQ